MSRIRVLALALIVRDGRLLVSEGHDSVKGETFHRLLGGELEPGETGAEALARELLEELGAEMESAAYRATLENIFTFEGVPRHEIVLVYDVTLRDPRFDDRVAWDAPVEDGVVLRVMWKPLDDFCSGALLYPDGALALAGA
jgi:8-oxo-dGTP pyrophosphatase MutT (NUDIX family)